MLTTLFAGLVLAIPPVLPGGSGWYQQSTGGEDNYESWSLGDGFFATVPGRRSLPTPPVCHGVCSFDFSAEGTGFRAWRDGYTVTPTLRFHGPIVEAVATCLGCLPPRFMWETNWGPVAITMTGSVRMESQTDPLDISVIPIAGYGRATAENHDFSEEGPWNYSMVRYEFNYAVVPEPRALVLLLSGGLVLFWPMYRRPARRR